MKQKFEIAKSLRNASKRRGISTKYQRIFKTIYIQFVIECILKRKNTFRYRHKGKYIESFSKRAKDWWDYILDNIYRFYLVHVTPNDDKTFKKYGLIHYKVYKPIHLKMEKSPNENILEAFLNSNGLKITNEYLGGDFSDYYISIA